MSPRKKSTSARKRPEDPLVKRVRVALQALDEVLERLESPAKKPRPSARKKGPRKSS